MFVVVLDVVMEVVVGFLGLLKVSAGVCMPVSLRLQFLLELGQNVVLLLHLHTSDIDNLSVHLKSKV